MAKASVELFPNGTSQVEVANDILSAVDAEAYFIIYDLCHAVYEIEGSFRAYVQRNVSELMRSEMGGATVNEINSDKSQFNLERIFDSNIYPKAYYSYDYREVYDEEAKKVYDEEIADGTKEAKKPLESGIILTHGIFITKVILKDITLSNETNEIRRNKLQADVALEVADVKIKIAEKDAKRKIAEAKGDKQAAIERSVGYASEIKQLILEGMTPKQAEAVMVKRIMYPNGVPGNATILLNDGKGKSNIEEDIMKGVGFAIGNKFKAGDGGSNVVDPPGGNNNPNPAKKPVVIKKNQNPKP